MKEKAWIVVFPMIFWSFFDLFSYNAFFQLLFPAQNIMASYRLF